MPENGLREQKLEATRRRGYLVLCACSVAVHAAIATRDLPEGNWRAAAVALLSAALLPAILSRRVSAQRLDTLVVWSANIGAAYFLWDFYGRDLRLAARESLTVPLFFAVWFGLLPLHQATLRAGLLYVALAALVLRDWPTDPVPLLYIGFLLFLIGQMAVAGRQIQQELSRTARYADLALTDSLTGLLNRRSLEQRLDGQYALRVDLPSVPLGMLMIDVDLFKAVNDTHGHEVGDRVLVALGQTLRACARSDDLVGRWGGEEFMLLVSLADGEVLERICGRIQHTLAGQWLPEGLPRVTVSIGAALSGEAGGAAELLNLADRRLYRAKDAGRACVVMDEVQAGWAGEDLAISAPPPELAPLR